jgi:coproporphyrinogen III oxidase
MFTVSETPSSAAARALVARLQRALQLRLEALPGAPRFAPASWLRDDGRHGGGERQETSDLDAGASDNPAPLFNRASLNTSHVQYDDDASRPLRSATALSCIIHPRAPRVPSLHTHISWTEMRNGRGVWRLMADLNPSLEVAADAAHFSGAIAAVVAVRAGLDVARAAVTDGDRYFHIPALNRHRGVAHFYVEGYSSGDSADAFASDLAFAEAFGDAVIATYADIAAAALAREASADADGDGRRQLAYHTAYLFQVLTLDRGTTSGLMVHDQNDVGIMGSLPNRVDKALLASWADRVPELQRPLVLALAAALPAGNDGVSVVDGDVRLALAAVVREHYKKHPEALELQARGSVIPPTVANHRP